MATLRWSVAAGDDLRETIVFLNARSPFAARALVDEIDQAIGQLMIFPRMGRSVPEYDVIDLRELIVAPYRVWYYFDQDADDVCIIAINHASRDVRQLLGDDPRSRN